jgi:hypothetical protein
MFRKWACFCGGKRAYSVGPLVRTAPYVGISAFEGKGWDPFLNVTSILDTKSTNKIYMNGFIRFFRES